MEDWNSPGEHWQNELFLSGTFKEWNTPQQYKGMSYCSIQHEHISKQLYSTKEKDAKEQIQCVYTHTYTHTHITSEQTKVTPNDGK